MWLRLAWCWSLAAIVAGGQALPDPVPAQLPLVLKVLTAERNRPLEARSALVVGIVYQSTSRQSTDTKDLLAAEIEGRTADAGPPPVHSVVIDVSNPRNLATSVARTRPDILYVSPLTGFDIEAITSVSRERKI